MSQCAKQKGVTIPPAPVGKRLQDRLDEARVQSLHAAAESVYDMCCAAAET